MPEFRREHGEAGRERREAAAMLVEASQLIFPFAQPLLKSYLLPSFFLVASPSTVMFWFPLLAPSPLLWPSSELYLTCLLISPLLSCKFISRRVFLILSVYCFPVFLSSPCHFLPFHLIFSHHFYSPFDFNFLPSLPRFPFPSICFLLLYCFSTLPQISFNTHLVFSGHNLS